MRTNNTLLRCKPLTLGSTQTATYSSISRGLCHKTTIGPVRGARGRSSRKRRNHTHAESKLTEVCPETWMITWFQSFSNKRRHVTLGMARGTVSHCKASKDSCHYAGDAGCSEGLACGVLLKAGVRGDGSERGLVNTCLCGGGFNNALSGLSVAVHRCTASAFHR